MNCLWQYDHEVCEVGAKQINNIYGSFGRFFNDKKIMRPISISVARWSLLYEQIEMKNFNVTAARSLYTTLTVSIFSSPAIYNFPSMFD